MTSTLDAFRGRILDADSHEMIPTPYWQEAFGDAAGLIAGILRSTFEADKAANAGEASDNEAFQFVLDVEDDLEINEATVWKRQGWEKAAPHGPSAIDMNRRAEVLDVMGVDRQMILPTIAGIGFCLAFGSMHLIKSIWASDLPEGIDESILREFGRGVCRGYNDWALAQAKIDPDRLRFAGAVDATDLENLMQETERLLDGGIRALWIPASVCPGGKSPADRAMAPFWSLVEDTDTTVCVHVSFEDFRTTTVWRQIPELQFDSRDSAEFVLDPWSFATQHLMMENYLATLILGGVFERHPNLRFGVIECGAHWIGPMAENLDKWAQQFSRRTSKVLSVPPSAYVERNIRVSPYCFEPTAKYVERFGLEDVYVYGSDYPHVEGGIDQLEVHEKNAAAAGDSFLEKYFVTNAEWILPKTSVRP